MSGDTYPKYQLPSGNWTTDKDRADRIWARHEASKPTTEPHCNHDPEAVHDGVCECGARICTVCGDETSAGIEVNGEPVCEDCDRDLSDGADTAALDRIAAELAGWTDDPGDDTDRLTAIVRIVRGTGREVKDSNEEAGQ